MGKTLQEILDLCQEKDIQIVDFKMTDIDGRWRHLSIPVGRLNEETMQYGIGFDGYNYGYAPVESSDMVFVPDLDSATVDPFAEVPTLTMIGDVMIIDRPANRPFDRYPTPPSLNMPASPSPHGRPHGAQKTTDIRSPEKGDITPAFPWMSHRTCETVSVS